MFSVSFITVSCLPRESYRALSELNAFCNFFGHTPLAFLLLQFFYCAFPVFSIYPLLLYIILSHYNWPHLCSCIILTFPSLLAMNPSEKFVEHGMSQQVLFCVHFLLLPFKVYKLKELAPLNTCMVYCQLFFIN